LNVACPTESIQQMAYIFKAMLCVHSLQDSI
jgi:hypothetical protein